MKLTKFLAIGGIALALTSCNNDEYRLNLINSESFSEKQITLDETLTRRLLTDSVLSDSVENIQVQNSWTKRIDQMNLLAIAVAKTRSDSTWMALLEKWGDFKLNQVDARGLADLSTDSLTNLESTSTIRKWAELNANMLKLSGEVRFGDALEKMIYETGASVLPEKFLKSVIYTHVDDQIFINLLGSSSVQHDHTTGGSIKLIQVTDFPESNEMTLKCECNDVRYLDVYIRIPSWAVNPTVTYGNVKYVPYPGEYCPISRKWKNGDEIKVVLKN